MAIDQNELLKLRQKRQQRRSGQTAPVNKPVSQTEEQSGHRKVDRREVDTREDAILRRTAGQAAAAREARERTNRMDYVRRNRTAELWNAVELDPERDRYTGVNSEITDATYRWINDPTYRADAQRYGIQATTTDLPEAVGTQERAQAWLRENGDPNWARLSAANLDLMNDQERELYRYHYAKGGAEQAYRFLRELAGELNLRRAAADFEKIEGKTGLEVLSGVDAGLDQFFGGMIGLATNATAPVSAAQLRSEMVRGDLTDNGPKLPDWMGGASLGQVVYDATTTTANMAPSILASALTGMVAPGAATWVGSGLMGAGAAGGARQEALRQGYSNAQATAYGVLVGGAEMAMEKILGGISAFGKGGVGKIADKLSGGKMTAALKGLDSALLQIAAKFGDSMLSEGSEEYVQELLDPLLRNMVLGEENELALYTPEALYAGLLGALTGGLLEGPNAIVKGYGAAQEARMYRQERDEMTDAMQPDIEAAAKLLEEADIEDDTLASAVAKKVWGRELTRKESKALEGSPEGQKVLERLWEQRYNAEDAAPVEAAEAADPVEAEAPAEDPLVGKLEQAEQQGDHFGESEVMNRADIGISEQLVAHNASNAADNAAAALDNTANAAEAVAEPVAEPVEAAVENVENPATETADSAPAVEENAENTPPSRTVEEVAEGYGNQAGEVRKMYQDGQDVDAFEQGVRAAWELGNSGIPMERAVSSPRTQGITESQRRRAYLLGQGAARLAAQGKATANAKAATGGTVRRRGAVKGQGVSIQDLSKTFNDPQKSAYKLLSFYAEVTGVDVVLYKGTQEKETGRFAHGENTVYIDIDAGTNGWDATDLGAYTMMRTFSHEFTHFVEKWNPTAYNDLREAVFAEMEKNGSDPEALVEIAMQEQGLTFDQASREVVAEALTDILPESQFVQILASKHKSLFDKLKERLEVFVTELKAHWKKLTGNNSREAVALKRQVGDALEYAEEIVQLFSRAAGEAVEAYQATVTKKPGKVHTEGITGKLSELQRASIRALEAVAEALDLQIHLYESTADENGIRHAPNGYYDTATGDIYLDIHAGLDGKGTMLFTAPHELTHFIKQWSPEKFQTLADFLVERYGEKGISVEELVERQQAKAQRMGRELSYEAAFEEMVADSMESMLADGDIVQRLAELKQTDKGLWQKLKERFAELVQKLKAVYKGLKPDSAEGKYVAEMVDAAEKLKELFTEGLTDAARNHHPAPEADPDGWDDSMIEFSARESTGLDDGEGVKFSLREPVEETKDLVAVHNLSPAKLLKTLRLGGLPMPSIAITRAKEGYNEFGEISLVFHKDTIDPEMYRSNKVYSGDAWTPTYPKVDYKVSTKVQDRVRKKLDGLVPADIRRKLGRAALDTDNLTNALDNHGGDAVEAFKDDDGLKYAFLKERGDSPVLPMVEQKVDEYGGTSNEAIRYFAGKLIHGTHALDHYQNMGAQEMMQQQELLEAVADTYNKEVLWTMEEGSEQYRKYEKDPDFKPDNLTFSEVNSLLTNARKYLVNGAKQTVDANAGRKLIREKTDQEAFEAWLRELFDGIVEKEGIRNNQDYFTRSGNRRSFEALHYENNLENVIRAMKEKGVKGVATFGGGNIFGAATTEYGSVADIKAAAEKRMAQLPESEFEEIKEGFSDRFFELANSLPVNKSFSAVDDAANMLIEAVAKYKTKSGIANYLRRESKGWANYSDHVTEDLIALVRDIRQMPVSYFEAKPQRAVGFDEVAAAIMPSSESLDDAALPQIKAELENWGVPVIEYTYGDNTERAKALNSVEGVKFSDRDPAEAKLNRALQKENAAQAEEIQYLRELVRLQGKVTNGTKFTRSSVRTLAKQLMKDAGAKGNYLELGEKLNGIYESIAAQDDPLGMSWGDIDGRIDEAARWLVEHIEVKPDRGEYANDILRDLRARRISLNEGQMAEVKSRYGSYNDFRRAMFGSFTLSKDGTPLDVLWQELASQYPDTFDADIGDADMALELADVVARLRETDVAAMEFEMQRDSLQEELRQKVYDGYWRVSTLQTVADQWQKKVDDLKRQHQDTMERLDKARKERDAANADRIASVKKVREQKNEAVKKVRKQYQESKKKSQESRNKTAMRHKIQRVVKELNDLLLKPDKKHHVPEGLRKAVAEALEMVNMDPADTEARVARYDELIAKETDQGKKDAYEITRQNILDRAGNVRKRLDALRAAYEEIKNAADPEIANAYDANISECLLELSGTIGDTSIQDMSMEQLSDVYDMYTMVLNTIRDANKAFNEAISEGIREMADNADREITSNGKRSRLGVKLVEQIRKFAINNLKPTYFFHYLGSRTFRQLYQGLLDGQGQFARNMDEARSFRQEQAKKYGAKSWDREKTWKFKATSGDKFSLNLEQIMSLYAYSKRDQSREHIRRGGIVIDSETEIREVVEVGGVFKVKLKGKSQDATAYNIDDVTLDEIIGKLTAKQRAFVDAMQDYLSDTMGAKGNEVSMKLYGIKLFKEKHYFPLKSAKEYSARAKEQAEQSARLKNAGFTKATKPHASNPIMLTGFSDVWADHVQDMSSYHAMTLPIEDLYRVYNYSRNGDGVKGAKSVVAAIENAFGKQATGYMDQLLKDMNGGQIMDSAGEFLDQMTSRFKKGAVFMSASVMIQQSSSVARALSEIDAKYLSPLSYVESLTVIPRQLLGKVNQNLSRSHDAMWAELKRYAPVAVIKEMGSFDMNMGKSGRDYLNAEEYGSFKEKLQGFFKDGSYRDEVLSRAPALADELAWCDIWRAVKREQHEKHPKLKISSEEFLKLCGQRFTEIIDKTQVYDSVLSRSANMRSKNGTMKMATNFMAEPTVNANMLAAAVLEGKRGNKKKARRIAGAVMAGNIINAALAAIIYAGRDDDEDKEYWEKYLGHLSGELVDGLNPLTYIPVAQDIVSVFQGWDVERADMAIVSDLYNAWNKLFSDKATTWEKTRDMVGATTQIFGLPLKNALKDAEALWRVMTDAFDGQESTAAGIGYAIRAELPEWIGGGAKTNGDQLYESILKGDKAHEERVRERLKDKEGNIDEGKVRSALRKAIRENDSRIHEAAVYLNEGQLLEYYNIVEEIAGEGHFHKDDVVSAVQSEANALLEDTGKEEAAVRHKSYFKAEHFVIAAADGDSQMMNTIKADLVLTAQDNGKTEREAESAAVSSIRGAVKEAFVETGALNEAQAKKSLMGWCDATEKEAADTVKEWTFEKQNGYPLSELEGVFVSGEITADKAEGFLVSHGGYARTEAESKVLQWQCEKDTGIRYDDVQELYVDGKLTDDRAKELRVEYGESSIEDARKTVLQWTCEKDNGVKYSDIDVAYLSGDITEKTAIDWLVKYGEKDRDKAGLTVQAYRWRDQHTEYKDLSDTAIDRYIDHCEGAGISIPDFYEANKKASEIKEAGGTVKENVVRYIRSLPLSRSQKWAMWYAVKTTGWKDNVSF